MKTVIIIAYIIQKTIYCEIYVYFMYVCAYTYIFEIYGNVLKQSFSMDKASDWLYKVVRSVWDPPRRNQLQKKKIFMPRMGYPFLITTFAIVLIITV